MASTELAELRLWQLIVTRQVDLSDDEVEELRRLVSGADPAERLGVDSTAPGAELEARALAGVERWRSRAGHPLSDRITQEVGELVARSYEHLHAQLKNC